MYKSKESKKMIPKISKIFKLCSKCNEKKTLDKFGLHDKRKYGKSCWCFPCSRKAGLERRIKTKEEGIKAYGGKCQCCGENNPVFLTIDHINGREKGDKKSGTQLWRKLRKLGWPTDNFQLLCFNCNCAKGTLGYCPHELTKINKSKKSEKTV